MIRVWLFSSNTAGNLSESFEKGFPLQKIFTVCHQTPKAL